jgi:hypothetical protein
VSPPPAQEHSATSALNWARLRSRWMCAARTRGTFLVGGAARTARPSNACACAMVQKTAMPRWHRVLPVLAFVREGPSN